MVQIISGKRITEEKIKSAAKCAVSAIMSELPEEVQTVDILCYVLEEAKLVVNSAHIKLQ